MSRRCWLNWTDQGTRHTVPLVAGWWDEVEKSVNAARHFPTAGYSTPTPSQSDAPPRLTPTDMLLTFYTYTKDPHPSKVV